MKFTCILALSLVLSACGSSAKFASAAASSNAAVSPSPIPAGTATITSPQVTEISGILGTILSNLFLNLNLGSIESGGSQNGNISQTFNCPGGGTAAFTAQAMVTVSLGITTTAAVSDGSATITFTNCQVGSSAETDLEINGTASVSALQGNATAAVSSATFTGQGSDQMSGNLTITTGSVTAVQCTIAITNTDSATGTVSLVPLTASGSVNASIVGTACGQTVNQSFNSPVQI